MVEFETQVPEGFSEAFVTAGDGYKVIAIVKLISKRSLLWTDEPMECFLSEDIETPDGKPFFFVRLPYGTTHHKLWITDGSKFWPVGTLLGVQSRFILHRGPQLCLYNKEVDGIKQAIKDYVDNQ